MSIYVHPRWMITANAFELASDLEVSLGQSELLVSTLEFIELG